jgi:cytochrome c
LCAARTKLLYDLRNGTAMDSFEFNKIAGALLATCLALLALNFTAEAIFEPHHPAKPGFEIEVKPQGPAAGGTEARAEEPIEKLLASATVERGQTAAKACLACHNFQKGGPNGASAPNLYGIVGRARASAPGYSYSDAMKSKGGEWTVEDLNKFLSNPKDFVPGTKMTYFVPKASQRADVIAYLNSLADSPKPLPVAGK